MPESGCKGPVEGGARGAEDRRGGVFLLLATHRETHWVLLPQSSPSAHLGARRRAQLLTQENAWTSGPWLPCQHQSPLSLRLPILCYWLLCRRALWIKTVIKPIQGGYTYHWTCVSSAKRMDLEQQALLENCSSLWRRPGAQQWGEVGSVMKGFVLLELGMNGFGEHRVFLLGFTPGWNWRHCRQLTELRVFGGYLGCRRQRMSTPLGLGCEQMHDFFDTAS